MKLMQEKKPTLGASLALPLLIDLLLDLEGLGLEAQVSDLELAGGVDGDLAVGSGEEATEALEVAIPLGGVTRLGVDIGAVVIGLPDLDQRVTHRIAMLVENTP
jgi:hypothetical protein